MKGASNERYLTSGDVSRYLQDLAKRYGGYWSFALAADVSREGQRRLSVVLEHREHVILAKCNGHPRREWAYYPSNVHGSLAGCMWDLCYRLDNRLAEADQLAQAELPF